MHEGLPLITVEINPFLGYFFYRLCVDRHNDLTLGVAFTENQRNEKSKEQRNVTVPSISTRGKIKTLQSKLLSHLTH